MDDETFEMELRKDHDKWYSYDYRAWEDGEIIHRAGGSELPFKRP